MLACPRCSELPSVWLSSKFFIIAMVCSTNWVLVSVNKTYTKNKTLGIDLGINAQQTDHREIKLPDLTVIHMQKFNHGHISKCAHRYTDTHIHTQDIVNPRHTHALESLKSKLTPTLDDSSFCNVFTYFFKIVSESSCQYRN